MSSIYLDYNATTPADQAVVDSMLPYMRDYFGNPQSAFHNFGWQAEKAVDNARTQVASLIGVNNKEIFFTGSATESNNWVIKGLLTQLRLDGYADKIHIITSPVEHHSVLETLKQVKVFGVEYDFCDVDQMGRVNLESIKKLIKPQTKLISIMWSNNEIGTINPVKELALLAKEHKIYFHSDATQALGKMPIKITDAPVDLLTIAAHKVFGPKGVGALYIRSKDPKVSLAPLICGGGHENGLRSGTLNVPGIVGFGTAATLLESNLEKYLLHYQELQAYMWTKLEKNFPGISRNGDPLNSAPNILSVTFENYSVPTTLLGLAVSKGSACASGKIKSSHVLKAIGLNDSQIEKTIRISLGKDTTTSQLDQALEILKKEIKPIHKNHGISIG